MSHSLDCKSFATRVKDNSTLRFAALFLLGGQLAVLHALEFEAIRIEEEHVVVVLVVLVSRVDDLDLLLLEEGLQSIDVLPIAQLERIMMQADIADLVGLAALRLGDPVAGPAIGPADRAAVILGDLEAQEAEQLRIEGLGLRIVPDPDGDMVNTDDFRNGHGFLLSLLLENRGRLPKLPPMRLSVLDQSVAVAGRPQEQSIRNTVALAKH